MKDFKKGIFNGYILQRIKKNKNFMACITGPTGSGKTYTALKLAEAFDPNFTQDNIVFTPTEFLNLLNSGTLKSGSAIVADEFGVSMNSRNWQSAENETMNFVMQTFRSRNYAVFYTAPDFSFFDSAARKLFHCHMMTEGINHKEGFCNIKPYMLQINQVTGKVYYKFLQVRLKDFGTKKLSKLRVALPSKKLIKQYEVKKDEFVSKLNKALEEKLRDKKGDKEDKKINEDIKKKKKCLMIERLRDKGNTWDMTCEIMGETSPEALRKWYNRNRTDNKTTLNY